MSWRPLREFADPTIPKLHNLARAEAAGLRVPPTFWISAEHFDHQPIGLPYQLGPAPWILRSGSPTEDTHETSNAGQLLSLVVHETSEFDGALRRVVDALPRDALRRLGTVFVQRWLRSEEAGVAFCDGFYFERSTSRGGNETVTSGHHRGDVLRGTLGTDDPWSRWLTEVFDVFQHDGRIDIEFARDSAGYILLQSRPALFAVRRNPTLSLTNHREILGDPPSPWIVSVLVEAGKDLSFMAIPDPAIKTWGESYAVELGARGWMNLSFWHRWMDHFGMPRATVTRNFGGTPAPGEQRTPWRRFLRSVPALARFQLACMMEVPGLRRRLRDLDRLIDRARGLPQLHAAMVSGLALALRANFSINAMLAGVLILRRFLRIKGEARIVTQEMMNDYRRLAEWPPEHRHTAFEQWLRRYGHRGPLESDPMQPRFAELRDVLLQDVMGQPVAAAVPSPTSSWWSRITRPLFHLEETREWFRDSLMKRWQRLRQGIRNEAARSGRFDSPDDVFWLTGNDLPFADQYRERIERNRQHWESMKHVELPITATRDELERIIAGRELQQLQLSGQQVFEGIALGPAMFEGVVRKVDDLTRLLLEGGLDTSTILVVPTLEPSWAVVFPRVGGVIAEFGGEMSHASILLREARKPAIVNCLGIFKQVRTGDRVRLDGATGRVLILS